MTWLFAAEDPNSFWIPGDVREFWWSSAAFLVVVILLVWKAGPAIRRGMAGRAERIQGELVDAERAKTEAEAELAALKSKLGDADAERERIVAEAREQAAAVKADMIARADAEATEARSKAEIELAASTGQASTEIQAAVAEQAATAAESVVMANLDSTTQSDLIDRYIDQVNAS